MSATRLCAAAVLVAATSMIGCSGGDDGGPPPEQPPPGPTFTRVTKEVITSVSCGGNACHSLTAGGFRLTSKAALHGDLVEQVAGGPLCGPNAGMDGGASQSYIRVIPGDPENSLLYQKLSYAPPCGDPMPPLTGQLESAQVQLVYDWIAGGAKND